MNNQTIGDIYANNDKLRDKTKKLVASLTDEQTAVLPEGEKWTIAEIVEHIAIVQDGMTKKADWLILFQVTGFTTQS